MLALFIFGVHIMDSLVKGSETFEGFGGVIWHGNVNILLVAIQVNGRSTVVLPFEVHGYFVKKLKEYSIYDQRQFRKSI